MQIHASSTAIGGRIGGAICDTAAACALFTARADLPATSAMIDIGIQADAGALAVNGGGGTLADPLNASFAVGTGVVASAAVLVVLEKVVASIAAQSVTIGTKARSVGAALALRTGFVIRTRSKDYSPTSERDKGQPKPDQKKPIHRPRESTRQDKYRPFPIEHDPQFPFFARCGDHCKAHKKRAWPVAVRFTGPKDACLS